MSDSRFGVVAKYFEIGGESSTGAASASLRHEEVCLLLARVGPLTVSYFVFEIIRALGANRRSEINSISTTVKHS